MNRAEAVLGNRGTVLCGPISLVAGKSIFRVQGILCHHNPITGDFGYNRGGSDSMAPCISIDNGGERHLVPCKPVAIYQEMFGARSEAGNGNVHGLECRLQDVHFINVLLIDDADADGYRMLLNPRKQLLTSAMRELL